MKRIQKYLDIRFKKHQKEWDTVGIIGGDEGSGKTNLGLGMCDYWQTLRNGVCSEKDIKHICMDGTTFAQDLADSQENEFTVFDEAGELDTRRAMSNFNVMMTQAYKVIRADRLFTLLILPDLWDLEPRFRNRRVKFYIHVYRRGRCAVWLKNKLRLMLALNENRIIKNPFIIEPDFYDTFPIYKGLMADKYKELKKKKTSQTRRKLPEIIAGKKIDKKELNETDIKSKFLKELGYNLRERGEILGVSRQAIAQRDKKIEAIEIGN